MTSPGDTVLPSERPALHELAARSRAIRDSILREASSAEQQWLAGGPVATLVDALERRPLDQDYWTARPPVATAWSAAEAAGGSQFTLDLARLTLCDLIDRGPARRPALKASAPMWDSLEEGFSALLDALPAYEVPSPGDHEWLKDVWVAQMRGFPHRGIANGVMRVNPLWITRLATAGQRLRVARYLGLDFVRAGAWEIGHAWREFATIRRRSPIAHRMAFRREFTLSNPRIRGKIRISWMQDPEVARISPRHLAKQHESISMGGVRFRMGTGADVVTNALTASETRRRLHAEGKYTPRTYGVVIRRSDLLRELERKPDEGAAEE